MSKMGSHDPFGSLKHKLWPKEGPRVKLPLKVKNRPDFFHVGDVSHTVGKFSMRATTLLQTSLPSKVCTQSYGPPKLKESQFWEFQDSQVRVLGQNDIWVLGPWPRTEYTIRGKVMASPKSKSW
jgi:hypothetical protein